MVHVEKYLLQRASCVLHEHAKQQSRNIASRVTSRYMARLRGLRTLKDANRPQLGTYQVIQQLEGEYIWFWPELVKQWERESSIGTHFIVVPHNEFFGVKMTGRWGLVTGVDMGIFATSDLAIRALTMYCDVAKKVFRRG